MKDSNPKLAQVSLAKRLPLWRVFWTLLVLLTGYLTYNVAAGSDAVGIPFFEDLPLILRLLFVTFFGGLFLASLLFLAGFLFPRALLTRRLVTLAAFCFGCGTLSAIILVVLSFLPIHHGTSVRSAGFPPPVDQEGRQESSAKQFTEEPFHLMEALTKDADPIIWLQKKEQLADLFNAERTRLGDRFPDHLRDFMNKDVERHFWASAFLSDEQYLKGQVAALDLALEILTKGLSLCEQSTNVDERAHLVDMNVYAAIIAKKLSDDDTARKHKREAEQWVKKEPLFAAAWPSLTKLERVYYESIAFGPER